MQIITSKEDCIALQSLPTWSGFATSTNGEVYIKSALMKGSMIGAFTTNGSIVFLNSDSMVTSLPGTAGGVLDLLVEVVNTPTSYHAEHDS